MNFQPTGACDPLDAPAVAAFYAMGPQLRALIRQQWTGITRHASGHAMGPKSKFNPTRQHGSRICSDRLGRGAALRTAGRQRSGIWRGLSMSELFGMEMSF